MMANNDMSRWCVLYTAPKSERKLGTFIKYYKISQLIHTQIIAN